MKKMVLVLVLLLSFILVGCEEMENPSESNEEEKTFHERSCEVYFGGEIIYYSGEDYSIIESMRLNGSGYLQVEDKKTGVNYNYANTPFRCWQEEFVSE